MTYHIIIIGCQMNIADSERIASYLEGHGLSLAKDVKTADVVIITTCGVRQSAEDRVYGLVSQIKKKNKKVIMVITGCLSERKDVKSRLKNLVDVWLPIISLPTLIKQIKARATSSSDEKIKPGEYLKIAPKYQSNFTAYVPIGNGCNNFCSYCAVPYARGREVYRPAGEIIKEVKGLLARGFKEINLIAQNVNSYKSGAVDFPKLLKKVNDLPGEFWLRFFTSHPKDMSAELIKTLGKCHKFCEHVHLAVQSGDNEILKVMNRKYTAAHYQELIKKIRKELGSRIGVPVAITTDVIVGFPGETKKQFENTLKLFKAVKFDLAYISKFSPRFGTVAAKMDDDVSRDEKKRRERVLNELLKKTALANNQKYLNKTVDVLIEGRNRQGALYGKTRTYKFVTSPDLQDKSSDLIGQIVKIKIKKMKDFGLEGDLIL
jgi:tRNA-2-methylthio-N6-dimethylallyladenosine synthase